MSPLGTLEQFQGGAIPEPSIPQPTIQNQQPEPKNQEVQGVLGAAFRRENTVGAAIQYLNYLPTGTLEFGFNPYSEDRLKRLNDLGLGGYVDKFKNVSNSQDFETKIQRINTEIKDLDTLQNAGVGGWLAMFAAGALDPINFVPIGGAGFRVFRGASLLAGGTERIAAKVLMNGAARGAGVGLVAGTLQQVPLGILNDTRTLGETATNIGGAMFLGGLFGVGGAALALRKVGKIDRLVEDLKLSPKNPGQDFIDKMAPKVESDLIVPTEGPDPFVQNSVGLSDAQIETSKQLFNELQSVKPGSQAASLLGEKMKKLDPVTNFFLKGLRMGQISPSFRVAMSSSDEAKIALQKLTRLSFYFEKFKSGESFGPDAQTASTLWLEKGSVGLQKASEFYDAYLKVAGEAAGKSVRDEASFWNDVGVALHTGDNFHDVDVNYSKQVTEAAKALRAPFDEAKNDMIALKLLPDTAGLEENKTYFPRLYDTDKIRREMDGLASGRLTGNDDTFAKRLASDFMSHGKMTPQEANNAAGKAIENIVSTPSGRVHYDTTSLQFEAFINKILEGNVDDSSILDSFEKIQRDALAAKEALEKTSRKPGRGFTKARALSDVPFETLSDYLIKNAKIVTLSYFRSVGPDIEIARNFGTVDMRKAFEAIIKEYDAKIVKVGYGTSKGTELRKEMKSVLSDLDGMRNIIRGTYQLPVDPSGTAIKAQRIAGNLITMAYGGTFGLSAFQDLGRPVLYDGFGAFFGAHSGMVTKELSAIKDANELAGVFSATEHALARFMSASRFDMGNDFAQAISRRDFKALTQTLKEDGLLSTVEAITSRGADFMYTINGVRMWDKFWRQVVGTNTQTNIVSAAEKAFSGGRLTKTQLEEMAFLGINIQSLKGIGEQIRMNGITENGIKMANAGSWENKDLKRTFLSAIRKAADTQIQRPAAGDLPFFAKTRIGSTWLKLRTFGIAGMNNYLVPLSQKLAEGDQRAYASMVVILAAAAIGEGAKGVLTNIGQPKDGQHSVTPAFLAQRIAERSDILSYLGDINQTSFDVAKYYQTPTSYNKNKVFEDVGGIYVSHGLNVLTASGGVYAAMAGRKMTRQQESALWRMVPYQNLFRYRQIIDMARSQEDSSGDNYFK